MRAREEELQKLFLCVLQSGGGKTSGAKTGHNSREGAFYDSFLGEWKLGEKMARRMCMKHVCFT